MEEHRTTMIETDEANFSWKIDRFDYKLINEKSLHSPSFSMNHNKEITWKLKFTLANRDKCKQLLTAEVTLIFENQKCAPYEMNLKMIVSTGNPLKEINKIYDKTIKFRERDFEFTNDFFIDKQRLSGINRLVINCNISHYLSTIHVPSAMRPPKATFDLDSLSQDFKIIWETAKFSDFKIVVNGTDFPVHRMILAARSPYFAALQGNDWKETIENSIKIKEVDEDTFKEVLRFIYTGKAENLEILAHEILKLSELYQLEELTNVCIDTICEEINVENAVDLLISAGCYNSKTLKARVIDFISGNIKFFDTYEKFKSLNNSEHSQLYFEVYRAAALKNV